MQSPKKIYIKIKRKKKKKKEKDFLYKNKKIQIFDVID